MPVCEYVKIRASKKGNFRRMYKTAYAVIPTVKICPNLVEEGGRYEMKQKTVAVKRNRFPFLDVHNRICG